MRSSQSFSRRLGHQPEGGIKIRDDAPQEVREALLAIAEGELGIRPYTLREVLCKVLRRLPDADNWSEYPNVWGECQYLIGECPWYRVYDFVEALDRKLRAEQMNDEAANWALEVNEYFAEMGVGWKLVDGLLQSRGPEAFEVAVDHAKVALESDSLPTAQKEIHEALCDISRRPEPDLTGAIQHAMAALECTIREKLGDKQATLGQLLKKNPGSIPKPLDSALIKMWGYASETGRHLREGQTPTREEAELVVTVSAAACTFLGTMTASQPE